MCSKKRCSYAEKPEVLQILNELLENGASAKKIEDASGIPHSQAHRHKKHCLIRFRSQEIRKRNEGFNPNQRLVTQWPDGRLILQADPAGLHTGEEITLADLEESDLILEVRFEDPPAIFKNPRIHSPERARDLAERENAERDTAKHFLN